ncbi:glycine/betaine ABC transporter ATP-binding protein [Pedobacter sp. HMWF019]|uniref:ABC transporter ATP-binding protein n=1 Tax=Pedobacter sp. HMWF019 TaxID=2056856 RepID=UPI000D3C65A1|nr:ABC transporter ATP-binding protein [Pedobacter sp. HMWF019]PTT02147.1 glycine/betaine ABC transporter ATP-binding protein [Pedobacter sp. HMWF019]
MIKVENLSKKFDGKLAVDQISFEVGVGETMVLLGTSGCGKTTTLRMINRLIEPDGGSVYIDQENVGGQQPELLRRRIGYVLQNHGLFPHYTVLENMSVVPKLLEWDKEKIRNRSMELLDKLKLDSTLGKQYPSALSGGQQQRVGLARALMADPPILLMDEPFGALDNITRADIRREFTELDELAKKTIILVTHDIQEAFEMGDKICLMDKGKVMQYGTPEELLFKPQSAFVASFLKEHKLLLELKFLKMGGHTAWELLEQLELGKLKEILFTLEG